MVNLKEISRRTTLGGLVGAAFGAGLGAVPSVARSAEGGSANLVVYLSRSGNTRVIAGQLQRAFNADIFEIRTATPYPADYEEMVAWASRMRDAATPPQLAESVQNITGYATIFLGFPIWGSSMPAPMRTFLSTHDLSGKTLVPFITYGSSGPGRAPGLLSQLAPDARIMRPFTLKRDQERDTLEEVGNWVARVRPQL